MTKYDPDSSWALAEDEVRKTPVKKLEKVV